MKKLIFSVAVLSAISLASCKKADRVCECTSDDGTHVATLTDKTSKKTAKFLCESAGEGFNATVTYSDGSTATLKKGEDGTSCELK